MHYPFKLNGNSYAYHLGESISKFMVVSYYFEVATAVVVPRGVGKTSPVIRYSIDIISYSGPSGILGSDGKHNTA